MHRAKFVNLELSVLHSGAVLHVKERTGRLQSVRDENNHSQHRKDDEHDRERDRDIDRSLEKSAQWIFQRLLAQPNESKAAIFKGRHRKAQAYFQIAQDYQAGAALMPNFNHVS